MDFYARMLDPGSPSSRKSAFDICVPEIVRASHFPDSLLFVLNRAKLTPTYGS